MSSHDQAFIAIGEETNENGEPIVRALSPGTIGTLAELKEMIARYEGKTLVIPRTVDAISLTVSIDKSSSGNIRSIVEQGVNAGLSRYSADPRAR